jgi:TonB family protein
MTSSWDGSLCRWIIFSLFVHLTLMSIKEKDSRSLLDLIEIEVSIEADFATDVSSLPNAEKKEEPRIPDTVLPQLPKSFQVKEDDPTNDLIAGDAKAKDKTPDPKKDNVITKEDAARRAAIERLRKMQNSKKNEAEVSSELVKLKDKIRSAKELNVSSAGSGHYGGVIQKHIRPCYSVPTAYQLPTTTALVGVVLNEQGSLQKIWIEKSSGDQVFDSLVLKAVNDCAPLPEPPKEYAGRGFSLRFDPATM